MSTNARRKTAFFIAKRYLFSKKKHNIINVVSVIAMLGIMVSSAALIIVLSVFNGMETLIGGWFNDFNPDYKITLVEGKSFPIDSFPKSEIEKIPGVTTVDEIVGDMVLATYQDRQTLLYLKGVDEQYPTRHQYNNLVIDGDFGLHQGEIPCATLGTIAAGELQINLNSFNGLEVYYPNRMQRNLADPMKAFSKQSLYPTGVFNSNTHHDEQLVFCPIEFTRDLMNYHNEVTSIEVQIQDEDKLKSCQAQIKDVVGPKYKVLNKYEQEESLFKTMQSEKLVIYVILAFILLVAAFNIIGSLGMLILEKKDDTIILSSMGADKSLLQRIFIYEGMSISLLGGLAGMILGAIVCVLQQVFHLVKLGGDGAGYLINYYPVQMRCIDFIIVFVTIMAVSLFTSLIPAHKFKKVSFTTQKS